MEELSSYHSIPTDSQIFVQESKIATDILHYLTLCKSFVGVPDRAKRFIYCQYYKPYFKCKPALLTLLPCKCTFT